MISKNSLVRIKAEWQDPGDENIVYKTVDDESKGRVTIEAQLGMTINPRQVVKIAMLETQEYMEGFQDAEFDLASGWTADQALQYLQENEPMPVGHVAHEYDRGHRDALRRFANKAIS